MDSGYWLDHGSDGKNQAEELKAMVTRLLNHSLIRDR